jgi:hypothetical protein
VRTNQDEIPEGHGFAMAAFLKIFGHQKGVMGISVELEDWMAGGLVCISWCMDFIVIRASTKQHFAFTSLKTQMET